MFNTYIYTIQYKYIFKLNVKYVIQKYTFKNKYIYKKYIYKDKLNVKHVDVTQSRLKSTRGCNKSAQHSRDKHASDPR